VLVAAAGFGSSGALLEQPIATQLEQIQVNCSSVLQLVHGFGRRFRIQGDGALVLFSSIVAFQGVPGSTTYAASKAFVQSLVEGLKGELVGSGVSVLAVAPGPVSTRFGERAGLGMSGAAEAEDLVAPTLRALGQSGTCRPGFLSKLLGYSLAMLPRPLRVALMQRIMAGMIGAGAPSGAQS
jgi:short-subunit dehydrogenase